VKDYEAMKQAIGYVRVSTDRQAEGVSLEAQRAKIEAWALFNGYELVHVYEDAGLSGAKLQKRAGLREALKAIKKDMAIVVYSLSRLSRSLKDTIAISEALNKVGADMVSLSEKIDTTGASGRMVFNMLAVLAQFEREQTAERTSNSLQHLKGKRRRYTNKTPYGFQVQDGMLIEAPTEVAVIRDIREARAQGKSLAAVASQLNAKGVPTKEGKQWASATVHYLLKRSIL
jgi:site-specific DNA recombinase